MDLTKEYSKGYKGEEISWAQKVLKEQGFFDFTVDGDFGPKTEAAIVYFQQTHQGSDGAFLPVTKKLDAGTIWALQQPSGDSQRSFLKATIPAGLPDYRRRLLEIAVHEHQIGVKEIPDGSNRSSAPEGGIDKYVPGGAGGPWCMFFDKWCIRQLHKEGLMKRDPFTLLKGAGGCFATYDSAKTLTLRKQYDMYRAHDGKYCPQPGDSVIMLYREGTKLTGRGHVYRIVDIITDSTGAPVSFITIEGNSGNRVKLGKRTTANIAGYLNYFEDYGTWEKKKSPAKEISLASNDNDGTR
jgi:hypothetical protein